MFNFTPALLSTTGWFVGMLLVMMIVVALLAVVLVIALKPVKKIETDEGDTMKKLERRETELTIELLKNSNNPQKTETLLKQLREVTAAEKVVNKLSQEEGEAAAANGEKPGQSAPQKRNAQPKASQGNPAPAQHKAQQGTPAPAQPKAPQGNPAQNKAQQGNPAPAQNKAPRQPVQQDKAKPVNDNNKQ